MLVAVQEALEVGPEAGGHEVVFDEHIVEPVEASALDGRGAIAETGSDKWNSARSERIQEGASSANDPCDGLFHAIEAAPQPELPKALVGAGRVGSAIRLGWMKVDELDKVCGEEALLVDGEEDVLIRSSFT
ncbi:MAG: hypothetical protein GEU73_11185 [Chloroflexi bacterium]|nr:hypothetical protein [Chloroflexota bacterium]